MKDGWQVKKLGEICEVVSGQSPESKYYNKDGNGTPFYQGKKEFGEDYLQEPTTWTTNITKMAYPNDILMSVRAPVGDINFCNRDVCIGRGLAAIRVKAEINKDYLYYYLKNIKSEITGKEGAVFPSISRKEIENIRVPLPPLSEQQRIVSYLDRISEETKFLQQKYSKQLADIDELRQSYLQQAFEGKL